MVKLIRPRLGNVKPRLKYVPPPEPSYGQGRGGRPWRRKRDRILQRDGYLCQCEDCKRDGLLTLATEVDHIIPLAEGGTDDERNLRAINHDCHEKKTRAEAKRAKRWKT